MLSFDQTPYFDNHTHKLDYSLDQLTPSQWGRPFYHGVFDKASSDNDYSPSMSHTIRNLGATYAMVGMISKYLGCDPILEEALAARNALVREIGTAQYIERLYKDANITGSMMDEGVPNTHALADGFPCKVLALYRMDNLFTEKLGQCDSYAQMSREYQSTLDRAFLSGGYAGIKCHLGELYSFDIRMVKDDEAQAAYSRAKSGDDQSKRIVYYAIFSATMLQAQKLDVPIHVHGGITGGVWANGQVSDTDPFKLAPYLLANPELLETKLIVLHGAFPFLKHAATLAHNFPNVWVDMSWMTPWVTLSVSNNFRDIIGMAPISKILLGSGQHGIPEISWMAAKTAKLALREVLSVIVGQGILGEAQATDIGEMILYKNAERLYKLG